MDWQRPPRLLNHVIALNEAHVRRLGREFIAYYHEDRTHLGLDKDTPSETNRRQTGGSGIGIADAGRRLTSSIRLEGQPREDTVKFPGRRKVDHDRYIPRPRGRTAHPIRACPGPTQSNGENRYMKRTPTLDHIKLTSDRSYRVLANHSHSPPPHSSRNPRRAMRYGASDDDLAIVALASAYAQAYKYT
jgi:hypothetical protein